jgi:hypothetical protein
MAGTYPVVAIGVLPDQLEVILDADHRPRVAGKCDNGQRPKHGIDGSALESKLTEVRPRQQRTRHREELCGLRVMLDPCVDRCRLCGGLSVAVRECVGGATRMRATAADPV